jgi:hypothetical protein
MQHCGSPSSEPRAQPAARGGQQQASPAISRSVAAVAGAVAVAVNWRKQSRLTSVGCLPRKSGCARCQPAECRARQPGWTGKRCLSLAPPCSSTAR